MIYVTTRWWTPVHARLIPNVMMVFGDNLDRVGKGGQAIIRDEPNAVGIATKRSCAEYFDGRLEDVQAMIGDMMRVEGILRTRQAVLFPINADGTTSLGCGLSQLPERCPAMYQLLDDWFQRLPGDRRRVRLRD